MYFNCWKCRQKIEYPAGSRVGTRDTCPKCDSDLHACRNCQFYDPGKHNQCAETQAEWVRDKEAANYCNYFRPNPTLLASGGGSAGGADDAPDGGQGRSTAGGVANSHEAAKPMALQSQTRRRASEHQGAIICQPGRTGEQNPRLLGVSAGSIIGLYRRAK